MKEIRYAFTQVVPILFAYIFVGLASGLLLQEAGYAPVWALLSALFIYAGSMQIVMVTLMVSGVPLVLIAATTLFLNARHIFYGLSYIEEFRAIRRKPGGFWKYPYMALTVTDETYSVLCALKVPRELTKSKVQLSILMICHLLWVVSCTAGAAIGSALPVDMAGIEFSATALFVAVVVNQWREAKSHLPALIGLGSALLFYFVLGPDQLILPALSMSVLALVALRGRIETPASEVPHA